MQHKKKKKKAAKTCMRKLEQQIGNCATKLKT